jgi:hypothetical protein
MVTALILSNIQRELNRVYIEALHSQMKGYNSRLAVKSNRNADVVKGYTGKVTKVATKRRRIR